MENNTEAYLVFVVLGIVLVIAVGQFIIRAGQVYLEETFPDPRTASSVSKLLAVMFYLFALGVLGIISTMDVPVDGTAQTVVTKLGVVMLVLGIVFAATMGVLSRIRARRQEEEQEEALMAASMQANATAHEAMAHEAMAHEAMAHEDAVAEQREPEQRERTRPAEVKVEPAPTPPPAV